jgi:hypothetical protein
MKKLLIGFFLICFSVGFSQSKLTDMGQVGKAKLKAANNVSELVRDYPKDAKAIVIEITGMTNGRAMTTSSKADALTPEQKILLAGVDKGSKLYIEVIPDGNRSKKRSYLIHPAD